MIDGHRYVGAQAYHHALRAEVARARGDLASAAQELQLALVYDADSPHLNAELADVSLGNGAQAKAERASARAIELDPGSAEHWVVRARVLEGGDDRAGAERALRRATDLAPSDVDAPLALARLVAARGRVDEAIAILSSAADRAPTSTKPLAAIAELETGRRRLRAAAKALERALARRPADLSLTSSLVELYEREARWQDAATRWRLTLELAPDDPRALMSAARAELWVEQDDAADQLVDSIQWMVPSGALSHELGLMYLAEGRLAHAASMLSEAVRDKPADATARFALGVALSQLGHDEAALAELELIGPEHALWVEARVRIGHLLLSTGRFDRARLAADVGLAKRPGAPELVHFLALVHERSGRPDEALRVLRTARAAAPAELELAEAEAGILLRMGDRDRGTRVLRAAVELVGGSTEDGLYRLGAFLHRAGEVDGALELMQRIMREHPASTRAPAFVAWHVAERGVRLDEATKLLEGALALEPRSGAILDSLGAIALRRGRLVDAERLLSRAARLMPTDPDVAERLGDVLAQRGHPQRARARYVKSRDILARAVTAHEPDAALALARVQQKLSEIPGPALAEP